MSWEIIACCVWVIALIWCVREAYYAPTVDDDGFINEEPEVKMSVPEGKEFNKSYPLEEIVHISNNQVIEIYRTQGCQAVIDRYLELYLEVDELITEKGIASKVIKIMDINPDFGYELNNIEKFNKISEIISNVSIKKYKNGKN